MRNVLPVNENFDSLTVCLPPSQRNLHFLFRNQSGEMLKGSVVGFFGIGREKTRRQLATRQVRVHADATNSMLATRRIGTGAILFVCFDFAFHVEVLLDQERFDGAKQFLVL